MKLPDKREVGSSTLPRPITFRLLPRKRLRAGGVFRFWAGGRLRLRVGRARNPLYSRNHAAKRPAYPTWAGAHSPVRIAGQLLRWPASLNLPELFGNVRREKEIVSDGCDLLCLAPCIFEKAKLSLKRASFSVFV